MSRIYSVDVKAYATAYIKADSEEEALEIARTLRMDVWELPKGQISEEVDVTGEQFSDEMPDVSISPVMTCHGPDDDAGVDCVYDSEDEE